MEYANQRMTMRSGNARYSAWASAKRYALVRVGWDQSARCPLGFGYRLGRRRVAGPWPEQACRSSVMSQAEGSLQGAVSA